METKEAGVCLVKRGISTMTNQYEKGQIITKYLEGPQTFIHESIAT